MAQKEKTLTLSCGLRRKKCPFPRFPSFRFCPSAKIENSDLKISGKKFRVLELAVIYVGKTVDNRPL